ncbi:MAG: hypothetical protein UU56_C0006G0011 [Candidatus Curtissbacteria bacterium GW2011_GWA2_41_24]|uniref:Glycosyltransferase RgtA/B/C/D-like domain-containing protein n=1 Tax=Candidatus Curtissbacteria bacterium GW2011_GWA2_41_24 TaxID=1618411 RepID=A0A0G0VXI8_9BACT|nr:MAG: hypothetical protein UU56_C0006G0011 [Candidatus Curtissbacteria bacterium GW2011_GWA2_41_24]
MSNAKIPNMMIWLILLVTFVLRMINLNQSLWLDEAINVNVAKALSYKSLIFNYSLGDFHPPLYHIILKSWILFFGSSEISVRIPSVILGVATVFVTYLIGKKLFENKTALIAATLMATSPLSIYYSQEARMYMLAAFFASLSVFFFISILKKDDFWLWFGFIISTALMLYSDYLPYLLIPIYFLYLLINKRKVAKNTLKSFIPAFILISILITPWLIILPKQISVGLSAATASPAWAQVVGAPSIQNLLITFVKFTIGRISYDNNLVYALLFAPAAFFIIFLFLLSLFRMSPLRFFLWFWFFGPVFLGFLTRSLLFLALAVNLTSATFYFLIPRFQRENWREATSYVIQNSSQKTISLFESDYPPGPFDYYSRGQVKAEGALNGYNADQSKVREKLNVLTQDKQKVFLFQYLSGITDPAGLVFQELTRLGFKNTRTRDFNGVGFVYEFER